MRSSIRCEEVRQNGLIPAAFVDCSVCVQHFAFADLFLRVSDSKAFGAAIGPGRGSRGSVQVFDTASFELSDSVPIAEISAEPAEDRCDCLGITSSADRSCHDHLAVCV